MIFIEFMTLSGKNTNTQKPEWRKELESMLQIVKNVYLEGSAQTAEGVEIEHYSANLNMSGTTENQEPTYNSYISDPVLYRANRTDCIEDRISFEDAMYALWDGMKE